VFTPYEIETGQNENLLAIFAKFSVVDSMPQMLESGWTSTSPISILDGSVINGGGGVDGSATYARWAVVEVPEPSTVAIIVLGLLGLGLRRKGCA
jgi:hypothetical protein